jgi:two-component system, NtrC family, sensor kinase
MKRKAAEDADPHALISGRRYRKLLTTTALSASLVAVIPLLIMAGISSYQYRGAFRAEITRPMVRFAANGKQSLESFLTAHLSALDMVVRERPYEQLRDPGTLAQILANLKQAFGGYVDLGVVDMDGLQVAYAGPYELEGRSYRDHDWFREVSARGVSVSDVFMGYREFPHFVIAIQRDLGQGQELVLRATIDTDVIDRLALSLVSQPSSDAFIVNRGGVLQTPSRFYGGVLETVSLPALPNSTRPEIIEMEDEDGESRIISYAQIEGSHFTLVLVSPQDALDEGFLSLRRNLAAFLVISIVLMLAVIVFGTRRMVNRVREADLKRAALFHKVEYTNKMAAIGRLGAGVAHEINNPLAIINQKAGLLRDYFTLTEELPPKETLLELVDSVLRSVDRCGGITHRLLGFAKHMDVQWDNIDLDELLRDVLGFLEKEAGYRSITIEFNYPEKPPTIVSDRAQLQQVFLNIINNAFAAMADGGRLEIGIQAVGGDAVGVSISDDGGGISDDHMAHIFDPFFTTKKSKGTGLGLSITYGIVQKLGGQVSVKSKIGEGTCFTVTLPKGRIPA